MSSRINKTLASIPIKVISRPVNKFHWKRRAVQIAILILLVLIPVSGLFRIDPENGALVVLGWQIWFSDFFLISGLWITLASALVGLYSVAGTVFCGWACPQNSLAEWANYMTRKMLGKRAEVSLNGDAPMVAAAKNKVLNWSVLGASFIGVAMLVALVPLLYFYPPDVVWSFISFRTDTRLAGSLYWIYFVWVLMILLDIAVLRHFWCRFACVYKVWQHSFKTKETLHVIYDQTRADECGKCNYCVTTCFIDLDPRKTEVFDSCINCGDCIDACNSLQAKKGAVGLLTFQLGQRESTKKRTFRDNSISIWARFQWTAMFAALGIVMLSWGVWSYQPYHVAVGYLESAASKIGSEYRVEITSKRYRPTELTVGVEGLPPSAFSLTDTDVKLTTVGRISVGLTMSPELKKGLYPFVVVVRSTDGWVGRFNAQHFVE